MDLDKPEISRTVARLRGAGFALHWLHPRTKKPIGDDWSERPVATVEQLLANAHRGNNLGVRLGEYSRIAGGYLHVLDLDIRVSDDTALAYARLAELFPNYEQMPCVASGSGGESRHFYLITDKPFRSKLLATSEGKHRRTKSDGKEGWSYDWEIELFGTGKHVAMPPSIHPDTGKPYRWAREFDFDMLDLGLVEMVPATRISALAVTEHSTFQFEATEPLDLKPGQLEKTLDKIAISDLHYDDWIRFGQAIHHQTGGTEAGWQLWLQHTRRSAKYDKDDRTMRAKWRSFGKYRGKPVTMASIIGWATEARHEELRSRFDEEPEEGDALDDENQAQPTGSTAKQGDALFDDGLDDVLGAAPARGPARAEDEFDDGLGDSAAPAAAGTSGLNWISLLGLNEEGAVKPTLHNIELLVCNDPRLIGLPQLNEFTQETVQRTPPGTKARRRKNQAKETRQLSGRIWDVRDTVNGELWSAERDFAVRSILEAPETQGGYNIKLSDRDLKAAIVLASHRSAFHPVREYLESTKWDGVARVESLFSTYLGSPNDSYTRSVSRLMMVAAVTRIYEPGHKFDFAVILEGLQGKRKSTFIQTLGRNWFAELDGDFSDSKHMIELMQGAWIMEIPELSGMQRGEVLTVKAFISRQRDRARLAYAARAAEFPRQCIFIGSTNDRRYLKDDTGGRRFWPMLCTIAGEIDTDTLETNVDQLWGEALVMYRAMRAAKPRGTLPLYLTDPEARAQALRLQESRRVESADDAMAGRIAAWLDKPVVSGSIDHDGSGPRRRNITCLIEIWVEGLGNDARSYDNGKAQMIGRALTRLDEWVQGDGVTAFPEPYGRQRFFTRFGMTREEAKAGA